MQFAVKHHLYVVEDNAQAIGATYTFPMALRNIPVPLVI